MKINRQFLAFLMIVAVAMFGFAACSRDTGVEAAREPGDEQPGPLPDSPAVSAAEQDFMMKVTQSNVGEIMMARQAMQKSRNKDVKDFANMIDKDHSKALERLTELMQEKNVSQSRVPPQEMAEDMDTLHNLSGADFDREYVNMMVEKHQKGADMFRDQSENARNPDVRAFASELLPTIEMHLEKAHSLQSQLFNGGAR